MALMALLLSEYAHHLTSSVWSECSSRWGEASASPAACWAHLSPLEIQRIPPEMLRWSSPWIRRFGGVWLKNQMWKRRRGNSVKFCNYLNEISFIIEKNAFECHIRQSWNVFLETVKVKSWHYTTYCFYWGDRNWAAGYQSRTMPII